MKNAMRIDGNGWPEGKALAMAYVLMQLPGEAYSPAAALRHGTLFRALDKPFTGIRQVICE